MTAGGRPCRTQTTQKEPGRLRAAIDVQQGVILPVPRRLFDQAHNRELRLFSFFPHSNSLLIHTRRYQDEVHLDARPVRSLRRPRCVVFRYLSKAAYPISPILTWMMQEALPSSSGSSKPSKLWRRESKPPRPRKVTSTAPPPPACRGCGLKTPQYSLLLVIAPPEHHIHRTKALTFSIWLEGETPEDPTGYRQVRDEVRMG